EEYGFPPVRKIVREHLSRIGVEFVLQISLANVFAIAKAEPKTVSLFFPRLLGVQAKGARRFAIRLTVVLLGVAFDKLELDGDLVWQVAKVQLTYAKVVFADVEG